MKYKQVSFIFTFALQLVFFTLDCFAYHFEKTYDTNSAQYFTRLSNGFIFIGENGITFQKMIPVDKRSNSYGVGENPNEKYDICNLNISFKTSSQKFVSKSLNKNKKINSFFKNNNQSTFAIDTLVFQNIGSNVFSKYYFHQQDLEYDFIIRSDLNVEQIEMEVSGEFENLSINSEGQLSIKGKEFNLTEKIPLAYQIINGKREIIQVSYKVIGPNSYAIQLKDYKKGYEIIIDPVLDFSGFYGGNASDFMLHGDMAHDYLGNIYTTGTTLSPNFPTTPGAFSTILSGLHDLVIIKLDVNGISQTLSYLIGNHEDYGFGIDVSNTEVIVTGVSMSTDYPTTAGAYQSIHSTFNAVNGDVVITKFDLGLNNILASTFLGGNADEEGHEIIFANNGNIIIAGQGRAGMPTTPGCYQPNCTGDYDYIVAVFNPTLSSLIASTFIGSVNRDRGYGVAVDAFDNIFVNGYIQTGGFPTTTGAYDVSYNGGTSDIAVCKFNSTLSTLLYSTYVGSNGFDQSFCAMEVLPNGEAIVSGKAGSNSFPTTSGAYNLANSNTLGDVCVFKLNAFGSNLIFSSVFGGSGLDISYNLSLDSNGNIALTGGAENNFPFTPCCFDSTFNGGTADIFFTILSSNASTLIYSTYIGGSDNDIGKALYFNNQEASIFGNTSSTNFPSNNTAYPIYGGSQDIFGLRLEITNSTTVNFSQNSTCLNTPTNFTSDPGIISAQWNFGDPASGINNTSNLLNPSHNFSSAGTYTVTFIGTNSCGVDTVTQSVTIAPPLITNTNADTTICLGSSLLLTATGGSSYVWNNGVTSNNDSITVTPLNNMQYVVTAETNGCTALADTVNITIFTSTSVNIIGDSAVCSGNSLTLIAGGNSNSFIWTGPINSTHDTIVITPNINTTVYLQGTGGLCGNNMDSLNITVSSPIITVASPDTIVCPNSSLALTATGGTLYTWNNGISSNNDSINVQIVSDTSFVVFAQSPGCQSIPDTININVAPFASALIMGDSTVCIGETLSLVAFGNSVSYQWSGGFAATNDTLSFSPIGNTVIYLQGTLGICNSPIDSIEIIVDIPPISTFNFSNTLCANASINFTSTSTNVNNYYWNFGDSISNLYYYSYQQNPIHTYNSAGVYNVTLIASNSCGSDTSSQQLNVGLGPNANLPNDSTICAGQSLTLVSNGGIQYNWSGGISSTNDSITVSPSVNTIYTLTISDGICFGLTDSIFVIVDYPANIDIVGDNNLYCPGDTVKLYGTGGTNAVWSFNGNLSYSNPLTITPGSSGMVYASNASLVCPLSIDSFYVSVATKSNANFEISVDSCLGRVYLENKSTGASNYAWQILDVLESDKESPFFDITPSSEYQITLISNPNSNCSDTIKKVIEFDDQLENHFFIPNTFTPNHDVLNDEFIIGKGNYCKNLKLYIYNRWGNMIHFAEGFNVKWDGKFEGIDVPTGVYVYLLQIGELEKTGTVTLYR